MNLARLIRRLRGWILARFGVSIDERATAAWWEIDLLIVLFLGAWALGIAVLLGV